MKEAWRITDLAFVAKPRWSLLWLTIKVGSVTGYRFFLYCFSSRPLDIIYLPSHHSSILLSMLPALLIMLLVLYVCCSTSINLPSFHAASLADYASCSISLLFNFHKPSNCHIVSIPITLLWSIPSTPIQLEANVLVLFFFFTYSFLVVDERYLISTATDYRFPLLLPYLFILTTRNTISFQLLLFVEKCEFVVGGFWIYGFSSARSTLTFCYL